jgi:hypothetical protein
MLFFPTLNLPSERIRCEDPEGQKENPVACLCVRFRGTLVETTDQQELSSEDALCYEEKTPRIYFRDRLQCFKWNWFTVVMATGGIADVIYSSRDSSIKRNLTGW